MCSFRAVDFDTKRCWRFRPSQTWLRRNYCDAPVSIGFVVGRDITARQIETFLRQEKAEEADYAAEYLTPKPW